MSSDQMTFQATKAIEFANRETGEPDKTFEVFFREPTYREIDQAVAMQQHAFRAIVKAHESGAAREVPQAAKDQDDDGDGFTSSQIMFLLTAHSDLKQALKDFERLAIKVGSFNSKTDFIEKHYRLLSIKDIRRLCGEYLAFFIMPSVFAEMESDI